MTTFVDLLSSGDLRSDGFSNEVARIVAERPDLLPHLLDALTSTDRSVRGHAADALEKVSRGHPFEVASFLPQVVRTAQTDDVPMVRWHLAMVLGHLAVVPRTIPQARRALRALLRDPSAFVRSWAISSLCIIAKRSPHHAASIIRAVAPLTSDPSAAVAKRAQTAIRLLANPHTALPRTWIKSQHIRDR